MSFTKSILEGFLPFTRANLPLNTAPWAESEQMENWAALFEILLAFQFKDDSIDTEITTINTTISGITGAAFTPVYGTLAQQTETGHSASSTFLLCNGTGTTLDDGTASNVTFSGGGLSAGQMKVGLAGVYVFIASATFVPVATAGAAGSTEISLAARKNGSTLGNKNGRLTRFGVPTHVDPATHNVDTYSALTPKIDLTAGFISSCSANDVFDGFVTIGAGFGTDSDDAWVATFRIA
jgi:hypothetical protein